MGTAIEVEGLAKQYRHKLAVSEVSLAVAEGEAFGYVGPNGAGKTTTIRCMLGLVRPTAGTIRILGHDVATDLDAVLADVGHLPGEFGLWPQSTGAECLEYLGALQRRPPVRRRELCDRLELSQAELRRQVRLYSRGMKQKVGIIQAFQHEPRVLVLDEPTEGLDPVMKERFVGLLAEHRQAGGTTFLSSHILSEVEQTTERVAVLRAGRIVRTGTTADLTGERVLHCTLVLKQPLIGPAGLDIEGVSGLDSDGLVHRFEFRGDMEPLMRRLGALPVREFVSEPEHLAETFFEIYGDPGQGRTQ
ncbi:ABC transporter ATP-binding protein [Kribbella sp. NPDC050820]|uniref:ABC transporter ATP-binding protein n=1 Tax=Kribbella sp. NPDC050820 TaxID=3155408 RepID=UPI0033D28FD3